jgi:hypothetical protein
MRPVRWADNLTTILCRCQEIWETLTSWKPLGHPRPVTGLLYLYLYFSKIIESNTEKLELLTLLKEMIAHFHNATFILPLVSSGIQHDDDDTVRSKHVAEWVIL